MSTLHIHIRGTDCISVTLIRDIVNHSAGLITSYHMRDAVRRRMFIFSTEVEFTNMNTITICDVLCISATLA